MNPLIFREYDIRGQAERDLTNPLAKDIGRAFGTWLRRQGARRIAVSRDCRLSSPRLHNALQAGLLETGLTLIDIGEAPTPLMYFTVFDSELDGGIQITGSHNPPEDNGFKMMLGKQSLFGEQVQALRALIEARDFDQVEGGRTEAYDPLPRYVGYIRGNVELAGAAAPDGLESSGTNGRPSTAPLRFAIDAGNGAGGPAAVAVMHALGLDPVTLYCDMDGHFPNHHPDPSLPQNLEALIGTVRTQALDFGIAFDGDADRIGVVDDQGSILWGDRLMILFARSVLARHPGATILGEVKCSQTLYDDIAAHGGRGIIWKTGHSLIKKKMKEEHALLAGEVSGHVFFADRYFGFDDAIYAAARLVEILTHSGRSLRAMLADVPETHVTPELRVDCSDEIKFGIVDRVLKHYRQTHSVIEVDGARIQFDGGWGLVRASNTQPALVLRFEADDAQRLAAIRSEVEQVVEAAKAG